MSTPRTTTTYAVLGLLSLRDWTPYELAKQVKRSLNWFWPRAERKIYDEPRRLVADGLASFRAEATGNRPRTVYSITDDGRDALRRWLDEPSAPRTSEFEAMVKVFFADAGSLMQLRTTIAEVRADAEARLAALGDLANAVLSDPPFPARLQLNAVTTRLQLEQEIGVLRWAEWADAQISSWRSVQDPDGWDARDALFEITVACASSAAARHSSSSDASALRR